MNVRRKEGFSSSKKFNFVVKTRKTPKSIMIRCFISTFSLLTFISICSAQVVINEVMSSNKEGLEDVFGNTPDWVELYNSSQEDINLHSFALSDNPNNLYKWTFPEVVLPANEYLIVFCSGDDINNPQELHTNFKISQEGEELFLTHANGTILSNVSLEYIPANHSYALLESGEYYFCNAPTPGYDNQESLGIYYSHISGYYNDPFGLKLYSPIPGSTIRYTNNGSIPSLSSQVYSDSIALKNVSQDPYVFSSIPTTPLEGAPYFVPWYWKEPQEVYKGNVVCAEVFVEDTAVGNRASLVYFVDPEMKYRYTFPVVSLISDSLNLFSGDSGIYVPGDLYGQEPFDYWPTGNFTMRGKNWERNMYLHFFEPGGKPVFENGGGMRIRGFGSSGFSQKSLNIYFRKEYGLNKIDNEFFPNSSATKFKRLIFRNSGNDFPETHFKDAFLTQAIKNFNIEIQEYEPIVLFMNGEYWGIHNMREKMDKRHFRFKYGIPEDEINVISVCGLLEDGDDTDYVELYNYIESHDLAKNEAYEYVSQKLDIESTIDYHIAEIYFANYDWPCNNYRMWKSNHPDDKWKYIIYDMDLTLNYEGLSTYETNSMEHAVRVEEGWPHCECSSFIFRNLLKNPNFVEEFIERFKFHLADAFSPDKLNQLLDQFEAQYLPEIEEHIARFGFPESLGHWFSYIDQFREFVHKRPCIMQGHLMKFFERDSAEFSCIQSPKNPSDNNHDEDWIIYPNPTSGGFYIANDKLSLRTVNSIEIFDVVGKKVHEIITSTIEEEVFYTDVGSFSGGIYFVKITHEAGSTVRKLRVE